MNRKFKIIVDNAHDTTKGFVYDEVTSPPGHDKTLVWIIDDVGEEYCLFKEEYEVVEDLITDK